MKNKDKYQFIWWRGKFIWFGFTRIQPQLGMAIIYEWTIALGFWELRKWVPEHKREEALEKYKELTK